MQVCIAITTTVFLLTFLNKEIYILPDPEVLEHHSCPGGWLHLMPSDFPFLKWGFLTLLNTTGWLSEVQLVQEAEKIVTMTSKCTEVEYFKTDIWLLR